MTSDIFHTFQQDDEENTSSDEGSSPGRQDSVDSGEGAELHDRNKVEADPFSPMTPLSPCANPAPILIPPSEWQSAGEGIRIR